MSSNSFFTTSESFSIAEARRRAWIVLASPAALLRLAFVIIFSASPRTAVALARVVRMRSWRNSSVSKLRRSALRWPVERPNLRPATLCLMTSLHYHRRGLSLVREMTLLLQARLQLVQAFLTEIADGKNRVGALLEPVAHPH